MDDRWVGRGRGLGGKGDGRQEEDESLGEVHCCGCVGGVGGGYCVVYGVGMRQV